MTFPRLMRLTGALVLVFGFLTVSPARAQNAPSQQVAANIVEAIQFRGARRVPQDTLRLLIPTKSATFIKKTF